MNPDFFRETYPIVLLYGYFALFTLLNLVAWTEVDPSSGAYSLSVSRKLGFLMNGLLEFIIKRPLIYRLVTAAFFGALPAYLMLKNGYEKYSLGLYILLGLYGLWVVEKTIRMIVVRVFPEKKEE